MLTPDEIFNFLTHLIAMNIHSAPTQDRKIQMQKPYLSQVLTLQHPLSQVNPVIRVSQPASHRTPPALVQMTQTQIAHPLMTCSPLQAKLPQPATEYLRPRLPINYNETLLQCLHRKPQMRTLHSVSIPFPDSSNDETQETDKHT